MILLDTNIFMYAAGAAHPNKLPSARMLERVARGEVQAVIDVETLQEILHRYRAIGRWSDGRRVYDLTRQLFPSVVPISVSIMDRARRLLDSHAKLMARDALHAAVVVEEELDVICSYDKDFDKVSEIKRVEPK
jgi:predicted nucleic acid-binding protein